MKKPWNNGRRGRHRKNQHQQKKQGFQYNTPDFSDQAGTYTSGAPLAYRSRFKADGKPGTKPEAVIIDMDGTMENWDGKPNPPCVEYVDHHHAQDRVIIVVTARDHDWSYQRTHKWLRDHMTVPFVGPICRPNDDERYACDFKRDVYERLSHVYDIVSAIDDDNYVLAMWRSIPGLEVVATNYSNRVTPAKWHSREGAAMTAQADTYDWSIYEPDDEEILQYESEVAKLKRRQPGQRHGWESWEDFSTDGGIDVWCNKCQHPWFEHDITGCTANALCRCDG